MHQNLKYLLSSCNCTIVVRY